MLTGLIIFLLLFIALLAIPVTLKFQVSWQQALKSHFSLEWAFGLVRVRIPAPQPKTPTLDSEHAAKKNGHYIRSPSKRKRTSKSKRSRWSSRNKKRVLAIVRQPSFRRRGIRFISDFWHAIHKRDVCLRMRIGLDDPADTGQMWAFVGPVAGMLANIREASIDITPEFIEPTFELDSSGNIRIIPLQLIYLTIGLILSPPIWRGMLLMRNAE